MSQHQAETAPPPLTTLTEDERLFRDSVREFAEARSRAARPRDGRAREDSPGRSSTSCSTSGVMGIEIPEAYGGGGGRFFHAVLAVEALSRVDPSVGVLVDVQNTLVINALLRWGNDEQKRPLSAAARRVDGRRLRAVRGRLGQRRVRADDARRASSGDGFVLNGRKLWITNGDEADLFIVFATVNPDAGYRGITAFLVERGVARLHRRQEGRQARHPRQQHLRAALRRLPRAATTTCSARSARATRSPSRR